MKKPMIVTALLAAGLFGAGIVVGQVGGITGSSAASPVATPTISQAPPDQSIHPGGAQDARHADGTVTAINGDTLTISAGNDPANTDEYTGVTTVNLTSSTQYDSGHDGSAAINKSSIKVGSYIIVEGSVSSDGKTITATRLGIVPGGPVPGR